LRVDLGAVQQFEVADAVANPLVLLRECQGPGGVPVTAEGTVERHEPVADQSLGQQVALRAEAERIGAGRP
jgi:hypothetical protein